MFNCRLPTPRIFKVGSPARTIAICVLATLVFAGAGLAGPLEDADAALMRGDFASALSLLRPLAEQGNADAQISLGNMHFEGNGVPLNTAEAVKWYTLAADHGNANAQMTLGFLYEYGDAVPQDYVQAYKWFALAGYAVYVDAVRAKMNPAEIAAAQKLAGEWKPQ
jgi:TPR repeat protein